MGGMCEVMVTPRQASGPPPAEIGQVSGLKTSDSPFMRSRSPVGPGPSGESMSKMRLAFGATHLGAAHEELAVVMLVRPPPERLA